MNQEELITCKNCSNQFEGNYCNVCGQKVYKDRFTVKYLFKYLISSVIELDYGLWYTLKMLFINPGKVINEFISGNTRKYYHPFKYLILSLGIFTLIFISSGIFDKVQTNTEDIIKSDILHQEDSDMSLTKEIKYKIFGLL